MLSSARMFYSSSPAEIPELIMVKHNCEVWVLRKLVNCCIDLVFWQEVIVAVLEHDHCVSLIKVIGKSPDQVPARELRGEVVGGYNPIVWFE